MIAYSSTIRESFLISIIIRNRLKIFFEYSNCDLQNVEYENKRLNCVIKLASSSCSTHTIMKYVLVINFKMPTIVGILKLMNKTNNIEGSRFKQVLDLFLYPCQIYCTVYMMYLLYLVLE